MIFAQYSSTQSTRRKFYQPARLKLGRRLRVSDRQSERRTTGLAEKPTPPDSSASGRFSQDPPIGSLGRAKSARRCRSSKLLSGLAPGRNLDLLGSALVAGVFALLVCGVGLTSVSNSIWFVLGSWTAHAIAVRHLARLQD